MSRRSKNIAVSLLFFLTCEPTMADLIIDEVMANEPGSNVTLEWLELYNSSSTAISLDQYSLSVDGVITILSDSQLIAPNGYMIICRRLISSAGSIGFEGYWGDSSGYWGDTFEEAALATPLEVSFSLLNSSGELLLLRALNDTVSRFHWSTSGIDGTSWERLDPASDSIEQSVDFTGSTPGFINSITPVGSDLGIESVRVAGSGGHPQATVSVTARSETEVTYSALFLHRPGGDTLAFIALDNFQPSEQRDVTLSYDAPEEYLDLAASLSYDDRLRNNSISFVGGGRQFPAFILNEIMPNPQSDLASEWIELYTRSSTSSDLSGWLIGDPSSKNVVTETTIEIASDSYVVLAEDTLAFLDFYPRPEYLLQPDSWNTLRNSVDTVVLKGLYDIEADRLEYDGVFDNNITISRHESSWSSDWGASLDRGGTPGRPNRTSITNNNRVGKITISPNPFSPDGDGFEDETVIAFESLGIGGYTLKIYDRQGRVVREFGAEGQLDERQIIWNGRSDNDNRLPVGIYIVYLEQEDVGSRKATVVIAR